MVYDHSPDDRDPDISLNDQINNDWIEGLGYSEFIASDNIDNAEEVDAQ